MKPYHSIPIHDCGEPLKPIPQENFAFFMPHPYVALGAPYGNTSPWMVRSGVLAALTRANEALKTAHPGWKLKIFDAYRPTPVQNFMVEHEFALQAKIAGFAIPLSPQDREALTTKVFRLWAVPNDDPKTPPPHSTGAAIDLTIADANGTDIDMGSPIDENSDRSNPDHFMSAVEPHLKAAHQNRALLNRVMTGQGFVRHPTEWWHFSCGDQFWALLTRQALTDKTQPDSQAVARYGRADLVK
jgi:D-alanyl-D-alanine dipeptidase